MWQRGKNARMDVANSIKPACCFHFVEFLMICVELIQVVMRASIVLKTSQQQLFVN